MFGLILLSEYLISTYLIWSTILATEFMSFMGDIHDILIYNINTVAEKTEKKHGGLFFIKDI